MYRKTNILYIHGMGGGGDSRIPSLLKEFLCGDGIAGETEFSLTVRTYPFDPEEAAAQIAGWVGETAPDIVIGESLGALHAVRITGVPHILVSPSFGAGPHFRLLSWLTLIPGVTALCDRVWKPRPGDRQPLHFTPSLLRKYRGHFRKAMLNSPACGGTDSFFAFFGSRDHYRRSGVVRISMYRKYFGDSYAIYDGTHFMEEEYVRSLLVPKILETAGP